MGSNDKKIIVIGVVVGVAALVIMISVIGQGSVRHGQIFYPEQVKQTIAFQEENGQVKIVGISGIGEDNNPTLIARVSFEYLLTVINHGTTFHRLYIDGLEIQTDLLEPGQQETISIYLDKEGTYNYYDKKQYLEKLGEIKVIKVVESDVFQGIWKDLI